MKKSVICLLLVLGFSSIFGQTQKADIVVLLDNSGTMLSYYDEINTRVLTEICENFIRIGDTFHLISFNEKPVTEIIQHINSESDFYKITSRFNLLYPLGPYSDFLTGLLYSQKYINALDTDSQKVLIIISDGIFNPPETSAYYNTENSEIETSISSSLSIMKANGVYIYYIKAPFPKDVPLKDFNGEITSGEKGDGNTFLEYGSLLDSEETIRTSELDIGNEENYDIDGNYISRVLGMPIISCPKDLGKKSYNFTLPVTIENISDADINLQLDKILIDGRDVLKENSFISVKQNEKGTMNTQISLDKSLTTGQKTFIAEFVFTDNIRTQPKRLTFSLELKKAFLGGIFNTSWILVVIIILIIFVVLFIILKAVGILNRNSVGKNVAYNKDEEQQVVSVQSDTGEIKPINGNSFSGAELNESLAAFAKKKTATSTSISSSSVTGEIKPIPQGFSASDELAAFNSTKNTEQTINTSSTTSKISLPNIKGSMDSKELPVVKLAPAKFPGASINDKVLPVADDSLIVVFNVKGQNTNIGLRNVHTLIPGAKKSVGGGQSSYLIFLSSVPAHIAEIRFNGKNCDLALIKPEHFPFENKNIIEDCLDKNIIIRSDTGMDLNVSFEIYHSKTEKLNELLLSVVPEEDRNKYK